MSTLDIKKFNHPILRKKAKKIKKFDRELEWLVSDMKETMIKKEGIGLASNQIGERKQVFVFIDVDDGKIKELINPKIIKLGKEKKIAEEGCLSFPKIYLNIKRSDYIYVKGFNLKGEEIEIKANGITSRVIQHEIDHLNGILFFDRLPFFEKIKFKIKNRGFKKHLP